MVVTGVGAVTSLGPDAPTTWEACLRGATVVEPIPEAWTRNTVPVSKFWAPLGTWEQPCPLVAAIDRRTLDVTALLLLQAGWEATTSAGLVPQPGPRRGAFVLPGVDPERAAAFIGTGIGGLTSTLSSARVVFLKATRDRLAAMATAWRDAQPRVAAELDSVLSSLGPSEVFNPFTASMAMPGAASAVVTVKLGLQGPSPTFCAACAAGTQAIGHAYRAVRDGQCDLVIAGGVEALGDGDGAAFRAFDAAGALARGDEAAGVNRPFDAARAGFLFAEGGAGLLVLEERERARARGATVLAELRGCAETGDAHSMMAPAPDGRQVRRAIEACLGEAGWTPAEVGYVNAHGTGTPANDEIEAAAIEDLFGRGPWVSSTKSLLGHTLGASGAIEAVVTVLALRDGLVHPTRNVERPVRDLRFARRAETLATGRALTWSFSFGGQNVVLALSRPE